MGSFGGVKIDAQNFENAVDLAQQKALKEEKRLALLTQNTKEARTNLISAFSDGDYYVTTDFNSTSVQFQGDKHNQNTPTVMPVVRQFKRGEIVTVGTWIKDMAMNKVKVIQTDSGNFYADQNNLSKTKPIDPVTTESLSEIRRRNEDKTKIMIVGAFILGFLLSRD